MVYIGEIVKELKMLKGDVLKHKVIHILQIKTLINLYYF